MIVSDFYGQYDYGSVFLLLHFYTNGLLDNVVYLVIIIFISLTHNALQGEARVKNSRKIKCLAINIHPNMKVVVKVHSIITSFRKTCFWSSIMSGHEVS